MKAALSAYDGFDYAPAGSDLLGGNGGSGFSSAWKAGGFNASLNDNYDIASGSLSFGFLATSGNRVQSSATEAIAGVTRDLQVPLGADGTTRYISFLLRPEGVVGEGVFNGFFGVTLEQAGEPEIFSGKPGADDTGHYVIEDRGGAGQVTSGVSVAAGQTAFLVIKAEFRAGADVFTLYVNPTPGGPEPISGATKSDSDVGTVAGLTIYSSGAFSIDELRVGETFADVTPIANRPPDCSGAVLSANECWPPSHQFSPVEVLGVTDPDGDPVNIVITGIRQDEPVRGKGNGPVTCPDGLLVDRNEDGIADAAALRCERNAAGNGRVYHVSFTANDGRGGECNGTLTFCVPRNQNSNGCIDDGPLYDSTASCDPAGLAPRVFSAGELQVIAPELFFVPR